MSDNRVQDILDAAEYRTRTGGFDGFSFRDIAADVGIKSASVHYHFPTKADLGVALVARYTDRFMDALGPPEGGAGPEQLAQYITAFREAWGAAQAPCLCGVLGAERAGLPREVGQQVAIFFERNVQWLTAVFLRTRRQAPEEAKARALTLVANLEGAMTVANAMEQPGVFDVVAAQAQASLQVAHD